MIQIFPVYPGVKPFKVKLSQPPNSTHEFACSNATVVPLRGVSSLKRMAALRHGSSEDDVTLIFAEVVQYNLHTFLPPESSLSDWKQTILLAGSFLLLTGRLLQS